MSNGNISTIPQTTGVSTSLADMLAMLNVVSPQGSFNQTTQTSVDPKAVQAALDSILGGNQGLATVAGGQKSAGLYNSSMNTLLLNDLITKAAAQAASLNKTETVNRKAQAQINPMNAMMGALGLQLLGGGSRNGVGNLLGGLFGSPRGNTTPATTKDEKKLLDETGAKNQATSTSPDAGVYDSNTEVSSPSYSSSTMGDTLPSSAFSGDTVTFDAGSADSFLMDVGSSAYDFSGYDFSGGGTDFGSYDFGGYDFGDYSSGDSYYDFGFY